MKKISSEKLNFIIAACAILISAASFYATFLQARSAEQQVKAMTYPLLQFSHGNYDLVEQKEKLYFTLKNSAVGPALIKTVSFNYQGVGYDSFHRFLKACCEPEFSAYMKTVVADQISVGSNMITVDTTDAILSPTEELQIFTFYKSDENEQLWNRINDERFNSFTLDICYCSLLDQCYRTQSRGQVNEVKQCS